MRAAICEMWSWRSRISDRRSAMWRSRAATVASARASLTANTSASAATGRSPGSGRHTSRPAATRSTMGISHGGGRRPWAAPRVAPGNSPRLSRRLIVSRDSDVAAAASSRVSRSSTPYMCRLAPPVHSPQRDVGEPQEGGIYRCKRRTCGGSKVAIRLHSALIAVRSRLLRLRLPWSEPRRALTLLELWVWMIVLGSLAHPL